MRMLAENSVAAQLKAAAQQLSASSGSAAVDAEYLLLHVLKKNRSWLFTYPEAELEEHQLRDFQALLARRVQGEPVAYITGSRGFYGYEFYVSPDTLIPRADTELLIEIALQRLPAEKNIRLVDLGTGSGAIGITLALERPPWQVLATDRVQGALDLAERNIRRHQVANVQLWQAHWLQSVPGTFDAIISNPPYIDEQDIHLSRGDVRFEPRSALVSGADGLQDIREIIEQSAQCLVAGGLLALEHGYRQAKEVRSLMQQAGFQDVETASDLAGNERVTFGHWRGA